MVVGSVVPDAPSGIYDSGLPFDSLFGVPVHPWWCTPPPCCCRIAAIGLIFMATGISRSKRYGGAISLIALFGFVAAFLATASGRDLAVALGHGEELHFQLGEWMPWFGRPCCWSSRPRCGCWTRSRRSEGRLPSCSPCSAWLRGRHDRSGGLDRHHRRPARPGAEPTRSALVGRRRRLLVTGRSRGSPAVGAGTPDAPARPARPPRGHVVVQATVHVQVGAGARTFLRAGLELGEGRDDARDVDVAQPEGPHPGCVDDPASRPAAAGPGPTSRCAGPVR